MATRGNWVLIATVVAAGVIAPTGDPRSEPTAEAAGIVLPIDLVRQDGLELQSMQDPRWGAVGVQGIDGVKQFQSCGCWLATMSTIFTHQSGFPGAGSVPQYATVLATGPDLSFSPVYLDDWAFDRDEYAPNPENECGTFTYPDAFVGAAVPVTGPDGRPLSPNGFTWSSRQGFGPDVRAGVDAFLNRGWPVAVRIEFEQDGKTYKHMVMIVGFDPRLGADGQYLFLDPVRPTGSAPMTFGSDGTGTNYDNETYEDWIGWIAEVRFIEPTYGTSTWFGLFDDPEPIELLVTDPLGRRMGLDPVTGAVYNEQPSGSYERSNGWQDPLGITEPTDPQKRYWVRNPIDGVYAVEVIGTGDGSWTLDVWNGGDDFEQTLSGVTSAGAVQRYEIELLAGQVVDVQPVAQFGLRAAAGPDQVTIPGRSIQVDGYRSWASPGRTITAYEWDFGDGGTATGRTASHTYATGGTYTAELTVRDDLGATVTDTLTVRAIVPPPPGRVTSIISTSPTDPTITAVSAGSEFSSVALTPDGRYAAISTASRLTVPPVDYFEQYGLFRKDLSTGAVELLTGVGANVRAVADISNDGNLITFVAGGALVPGDTNGVNDVYLLDVAAGTFERIGVATDGTPFEGTDGGSMSGDGRYVVFNTSQVFLRDRTAGTTRLVSDSDLGYVGSGPSGPGVVSDDGTVVAFSSFAGNLAGSYGETSVPFVAIRDFAANTRKWVWTGGNSRNVYRLEMSADGRYVAFLSNGQEPIPFTQRTNFVTPEPFLYDRDTRTLTWLAPTVDGVRPVASGFSWGGYDIDISSSGEWVSFEHRAYNVIVGDTNGTPDMFLYHVPDGVLTRESVTTAGDQSAGTVSWFARGGVDDSGGTVFTSTATDLVPEITSYLATWNLYRRGGPIGGTNGRPNAELGGPYVGFASTAESPSGIRLDGGRSVDPEDDDLTGTIDPGDGSPAATGLQTRHEYAAPGEYVAELSVSDDGNRQATDDAEVIVYPAVLPDAVYAPVCADPGATIRVGGVGRTANAALIADGWDTSAGPVPLADVGITASWGATASATTSLPALAFTAEITAPTDLGRHSVALDGTDAVASFDVPCPPGWQTPPTADAGGPYRVVAGTPLAFDGSRSTGARSFGWEFGDGARANGVGPTHTFATPGTYVVQLVVGDQDPSAGSSLTESVTVNGVAGVLSSTGIFAPRSRAIVEVLAPTTTDSTTSTTTTSVPGAGTPTPTSTVAPSPAPTSTPVASTLPATGRSTGRASGAAALAVAAGLLLLVTARRPRRPVPD